MFIETLVSSPSLKCIIHNLVQLDHVTEQMAQCKDTRLVLET
jgi:hypothetical protein